MSTPFLRACQLMVTMVSLLSAFQNASAGQLTVKLFSSNGTENDPILRRAIVTVREQSSNFVSGRVNCDLCGADEPLVFKDLDDQKEYTLSIYAPGHQRADLMIPAGKKEVDVYLQPRSILEVRRCVIGFQQGGASSADAEQSFHGDFYLEVPLEPGLGDDLGGKAKGWGRVRLTSVPQLRTETISEFAAIFTAEVANLNVNEVAEAVEFLGGIEYRLLPINTDTWGIEHYDLFSASGYIGVGFATPLSPNRTSVVFNVNEAARDRFGLDPSTQYVVISSSDRDRFFRQVYVGFRFRTTYTVLGAATQRSPATLDMAVGWNEAVSSPMVFNQPVARLEGFYSLPLSKDLSLFLQGSAVLHLDDATERSPLLLTTAPSGLDLTGKAVEFRTWEPNNRDYYQISIGVDFAYVF